LRGVVFLGDRKVGLRDFPDPEPGPREAVVGVEASSICGSDLRIYRRPEVNPNLIQGHEAAGVVVAVGDAVTSVKPGTRVSVYHHIGCGNCEYCRSGDWFYCRERWTWGLGIRHGSFSNLLLTDAAGCFQLPEELTYLDGSIISCAGGTAYAGLNKLHLEPDDVLAVYGLGPVGLSALMIAKAIGVPVAAIELVEERLRLGERLGADLVVDAKSENPVEAIKAFTGGRGASAVAECSGSTQGRVNALASAAPLGRVAFIGMGTRNVMIDAELFPGYDLTLVGNHVFNVALYDPFVRLMLNRGVHLEEMVTHRYSVEEAEEAFRLFDSGTCGKVAFV